MNPSERNKCRYSLVILVIESSSPKNPDELSQRAADSLLDAPVAVFQFGREPNMRETSAREPEHSAEPHGTAHASSLVVNMPRRWSCKGVTFLNFFFFFLLFSILQGLYKSCSPRVKKNTKTINEPYTKCSNYDAFLFLSNVCSLWIWRYQKGLGKRQQRTAKSVC